MSSCQPFFYLSEIVILLFSPSWVLVSIGEYFLVLVRLPGALLGFAGLGESLLILLYIVSLDLLIIAQKFIKLLLYLKTPIYFAHSSLVTNWKSLSRMFHVHNKPNVQNNVRGNLIKAQILHDGFYPLWLPCQRSPHLWNRKYLSPTQKRLNSW